MHLDIITYKRSVCGCVGNKERVSSAQLLCNRKVFNKDEDYTCRMTCSEYLCIYIYLYLYVCIYMHIHICTCLM